jgi:hypothetical protein
LISGDNLCLEHCLSSWNFSGVLYKNLACLHSTLLTTLLIFMKLFFFLRVIFMKL